MKERRRRGMVMRVEGDGDTGKDRDEKDRGDIEMKRDERGRSNVKSKAMYLEQSRGGMGESIRQGIQRRRDVGEIGYMRNE